MGEKELEQPSVLKQWTKVLWAEECEPCPLCEDPLCEECEMHYGECPCPGPGNDELYEYKEIKGILHAKSKEESECG